MGDLLMVDYSKIFEDTEQQHPIEVSVVIEIFFICVVQYGGY